MKDDFYISTASNLGGLLYLTLAWVSIDAVSGDRGSQIVERAPGLSRKRTLFQFIWLFSQVLR